MPPCSSVTGAWTTIPWISTAFFVSSTNVKLIPTGFSAEICAFAFSGFNFSAPVPFKKSLTFPSIVAPSACWIVWTMPSFSTVDSLCSSMLCTIYCKSAISTFPSWLRSKAASIEPSRIFDIMPSMSVWSITPSWLTSPTRIQPGAASLPVSILDGEIKILVFQPFCAFTSCV